MGDAIVKALLTVLTFVTLWLGSTVQKLDVGVAVLQSQLIAATTDRYTGAQAKADGASLEGQINLIRQRIVRIEADVEELKP